MTPVGPTPARISARLPAAPRDEVEEEAGVVVVGELDEGGVVVLEPV